MFDDNEIRRIDNKLKQIIKKYYGGGMEIKYVIYAMNDIGMSVKYLLNSKYGIRESFVIDNAICKYNGNIKPVEFIGDLNVDDYCFLICSNMSEILFSLYQYGVNEDKIFYLGKKHLLTSHEAMSKLLKEYEFDTVLDVGCGMGLHMRQFLKAGKAVTGIDFNICFKKLNDQVIYDDFITHEFSLQYDCVWCSHSLEHQMNVGKYLGKIFKVLKDGGILALTVPAANFDRIIPGHVTVWNVGLLLYNLIENGFNCKTAIAFNDGSDCSVIVRKEAIKNYDHTRIKEYLPEGLQFEKTRYGGFAFKGNIKSIHWCSSENNRTFPV